MKKFFCDRCEKEIEIPKYIYVPAHHTWSNRLIENQHVTDYILCDECLLSFANWLNNAFLYNEYNKMIKRGE